MKEKSEVYHGDDYITLNLRLTETECTAELEDNTNDEIANVQEVDSIEKVAQVPENDLIRKNAAIPVKPNQENETTDNQTNMDAPGTNLPAPE